MQKPAKVSVMKSRARNIEKQFYSKIEQFISTQYSNPNSNNSSLRKNTKQTQSNNTSLRKVKDKLGQMLQGQQLQNKDKKGKGKEREKEKKEKEKEKEKKESVESKIANKNRLKVQLQKIQLLKQEAQNNKSNLSRALINQPSPIQPQPSHSPSPRPEHHHTNQIYVKLENSLITSPSPEPIADPVQLQKEMQHLRKQKQVQMDAILNQIIEKGQVIKEIEENKANLNALSKQVSSLEKRNEALVVQDQETEAKTQQLGQEYARKQEILRQVKYGRLNLGSLENIISRFVTPTP